MINKKIWNINLPVLKSAFVTNISPKQYDTASNIFKIVLYKDMEKYDLTGLTVQAVFKKADGTISYLPCTITNAANGELEIDITSQVLAIAAEVECEIRITGTEGELLIAPKFYFKVYESLNIDGAVESQDEFPVLVELLNRVETVETELQNITPEQIAQVTTNEQTRQNQEAARQAAEAERAGFYAGFNAQLAEKVQNFKLKNEVVNGDFSQGTTGWSANGSLSIDDVSGNKSAKIATQGANSPYQVYQNIIPFVINDKVYYSVKIKLNNALSFSGNYYGLRCKSASSGNLQIRLNSGDVSGTITKMTALRIADGTETGIFAVVYDGTNIVSINVDDCLVLNLTKIFGAGNEPTKLEMDELMKVIPNQWWDGELTLTQKQFITWQLNLIRKNTNAIIALGGTII